jgi:hypothetical protein
MTALLCQCRTCQMQHRYGAPESDDLLPSPEELTDLPDDLGTDCGELDEEVPVDD